MFDLMTTVPTREHAVLTNVFEWLDEVRARPFMYIRDEADLDALESMIWGYEAAIRLHQIDEAVPRFGLLFLGWVRHRRGWSTSNGWAHAVRTHVRKNQRPLDLFLELIDQYRQLSPRVVATVRLRQRHRATGEAGTDGLGRARPPPRELQIVRYAPEPLFVLRYRYPSAIEEIMLMKPNGSLATGVAFAQKHALLEFGISPSEWR